jgi:hypothetical protein
MYKKNTNILIFSENIFIKSVFGGKFLDNGNEFSSPDGSKYPTLLGVDTANSGRKCFYGNEM